jgi:uncharacterized Fe-S cluster protein YjdI
MTKKEYSNGEVTIVWQPDLCIHATHCWKQLPQVFDPKKRPWVNAQGANTERIIEQVKKCPSGALGCYMNDEKKSESEKKETGEKELKWIPVTIIENGPLYVFGDVKIKDKDGKEIICEEKTAFCRCGASQNKPFCDGSHVKINFKG